MTNFDLSITSTITAPRSLIYQLWTMPQHLKLWFAPKGFTVTEAQTDARTNGAWSVTMESSKRERFTTAGTYLSSDPPMRLSFTQGWIDTHGNLGHEVNMTVTFEALGGATRISLHQGRFLNAADRNSHRAGWLEAMENLEVYATRQVQQVGLI